VSKKFVMCQGLPASGKSTWAEKAVLARGAGEGVRVNMDLFRSMLHADRFGGRKTEKSVVAMRNATIQHFMQEETPLIVSDDTNLNPKCETSFRALCDQHGYDFTIKGFTDVTPEECIKRDLKRARSVGSDVIMRMYNQYLAPEQETYEFEVGLPTAIIVDIDGTLAHMTGRSPYEWHRVHEDAVDFVVAGIVRREHGTRRILVMSGRDAACRDVTEKWLRDNDIPFDELHMRHAGDMRKDSIVKRELFDTHVRGKFNVLYVLDDRNQVVREWRQMGLKCLQVAEGNF
jgi:predicted kinase